MYNPIKLAASKKSMTPVASLTSIAQTDIGMSSQERSIIQKALRILYKYQKNVGVIIDDKNLAIDFLRLRFEFCEREIFSAFFLNCRHQLIAFEELFYGTISHSSVFPREIVKRALALNAAAVILAHNHPSGCAEPSKTDCSATKELKKALELVSIDVLDHIIIGSGTYVSFAERHML